MDFSATPAVSTALPRPDARGHFGPFGGRFVPETLMQPLIELEQEYRAARADVAFMAEFERLLREYANRPTPLYRARNLERALGGAMRIYLKREDLLHTGAHKINNTLGQALLAKRMGKKRLIAETGAGQHGVATATAAALLGFECEVFMGEEDMERQALNVFRMRLMGARVTKVTSGSRTLKDATNEAMRNWMSTVAETHYIIGSVLGPHPFPLMVRDFQSAIGIEARAQILAAEGRLPDDVIACIGGGSNAMGIFHAFFDDRSVRLWGAEAAGEGVSTGKHAATITSGSLGVFHGTRSLVLQSDDGQILPAHSISAGLDYPGVGPEHAFYAASKRATYVAIDDSQALEALEILARTEGILAALESAHALAQLAIVAKSAAPDSVAVLCLSGRGDKDVFTIKDRLAK